MNLWTEYEGRTIAGAYNLRKLLRSEGRNAFFATSTGEGSAAVIRLTEAHFDEEETLKRWHQVAEVHQDNLIEIEQMGKTTFDGVALTYAVLEPNDADLEDVLRERPLTTAETAQVAISVSAALSALHASGLVHEHVEPANVLAVGNVVKLRSDCVRECVADVEFPTAEGCEELRRRDIHDFGTLLLRCLTLEKVWSSGIKLPEPFSGIIPHALDGSWGLVRISAALDSLASKPAAHVAPPASTAVSSAASPRTPAAGTGTPSAASKPLVPPGVLRTTAAAETAPKTPAASEPSASFRPRNRVDVEEPARAAFQPIWFAYAAAAILVLLLGWHFLAGRASKPAPATPAAPSVPVAQNAAPPNVAAPAPAASNSVSPDASPLPSAASHTGWYVIAYTYNHEDQARAKAARLNGRNASLHAQVFSPSGHAPYLVSLDGRMSNVEARDVLRRARHSGAPRDTFMRHY